MNNKITLLITLLIISLLLMACNFRFGEDVRVDADNTEKAEKNDKKNKESKNKSEDSGKDETDANEADDSEEIVEKEDAPNPTANAIRGSNRPTGESKSVSNALGNTSKPQDVNKWIYVYNSKKGYGFYVPDGSTGEWGRVNNVDTFAGATPDGVGIFVFAWKDRRAGKESLLEDAEAILNGMGETVTTGKVIASSDLYALGEGSSVDQQGVNSKLKVLVGTDVTDNYVLFVGTDADKYQSRLPTIDAIWGSFEMWSGGAGGR